MAGNYLLVSCRVDVYYEKLKVCSARLGEHVKVIVSARLIWTFWVYFGLITQWGIEYIEDSEMIELKIMGFWLGLIACLNDTTLIIYYISMLRKLWKQSYCFLY